jgi:hypothetical protein
MSSLSRSTAALPFDRPQCSSHTFVDRLLRDGQLVDTNHVGSVADAVRAVSREMSLDPTESTGNGRLEGRFPTRRYTMIFHDVQRNDRVCSVN